MITSKIVQNANKFAYLIKAYPEKKVPEIINMFRLAPIDINCAIWAAVELKFIREMDPETSFSEIITAPKTWDFGPDEADLEDSLTYAFEKLNAQEKDIEENYLTNWVAGYSPQDTLIAVKRLIEDKVLHEYEIEDGENAYIFYTLYKHKGKNWGAKQFKTNPLTGEDQAEPAQEEKTDTKTEK